MTSTPSLSRSGVNHVLREKEFPPLVQVGRRRFPLDFGVSRVTGQIDSLRTIVGVPLTHTI